tara:strand:- start:65 stop:961 length:897 start_codon:yes stop_codon:yes gene_type:complete
MQLKENLWKDQHGNIFYRKAINKKRVVVPAYTKNILTANKLHKTLEYQAIMQIYGHTKKKKKITLSELVKIYLKDKAVLAKWKPSTRKNSIYVLNKYLKTRQLPKKKETARGYQIKINACINWGISQKYEVNHKLFKVNKKKGRTRVYNENEMSIILNQFNDKKFRDFVRFAYYTGARRGELFNIKPHHIQGDRLVVYGKSDERYIKLNSQSLKVLKRNPKLWDYKLGYMTKHFKKNLRKFGIKNGCLHDLRRTFGLNLILSGMSIYKVSELLGHKSVKTTEQHYAPLLVTMIEDFTL